MNRWLIATTPVFFGVLMLAPSVRAGTLVEFDGGIGVIPVVAGGAANVAQASHRMAWAPPLLIFFNHNVKFHRTSSLARNITRTVTRAQFALRDASAFPYPSRTLQFELRRSIRAGL